MIERRQGPDRRVAPTFPLRFSGPRRRKSRGRRKGDKGRYVDIYDSRSWAVAAGVLGLSLFDGFFTARQILAGKVREANPLMQAAIHSGGLNVFFGLKVLMTAFPLAIIILHKEWTLARYAAGLCLLCYFFITVYHLYLVFL